MTLSAVHTHDCERVRLSLELTAVTDSGFLAQTVTFSLCFCVLVFKVSLILEQRFSVQSVLGMLDEGTWLCGITHCRVPGRRKVRAPLLLRCGLGVSCRVAPGLQGAALIALVECSGGGLGAAQRLFSIPGHSHMGTGSAGTIIALLTFEVR